MRELWNLVVSGDGTVVAGVDEAHVVHVVPLANRTPPTEFKVVWDAGGDRLALSEDARWAASAQYSGEGVGIYDVSRARPVWRRRDVRKAQSVQFLRERLLVIREEGGGLWLDVAGGATLAELPGVRDAHASIDGRFLLIAKRTEHPYELIDNDGRPIRKLERSTFAILAAAFTERLVVVSESGGPVSCWALDSGSPLWRHQPEPGHHMLALGVRASNHEVVGVDWPYERGGTKTLVALLCATGEVVRMTPLPEHLEAVFALDGERIVLSTGSVVQTSDGLVIDELGVWR